MLVFLYYYKRNSEFSVRSKPSLQYKRYVKKGIVFAYQVNLFAIEKILNIIIAQKMF